jgi:hypothetical protein
MKLSNYFTTALFAAAGLAATASATTLSVGTGDLVLGFQTTGIGSTNNVEIDLGAVSGYQTAFSNSQSLVIGNFNADLTAAYGSDWNTRSDITWSFAGNLSNTNPTKTVFVSKVETVVGVQSAAFTSSFSNGTLGTAITGTSLAISGLNAKESTTNSDTTAILDSSLGNAYTAAFGTDGLAYRIFVKGDVQNTTDIAPGSYSVSDLYQVKASGAYTYLGSFGLSDTGVLSYSFSASTFSAVPEPSTYGALAGAAVLGFVGFRRRRQVKA